jgi:uncharacterized membrane protein
MANRRNLIMDAPVHPAFLPGLFFIADEMTVDNASVVTVTFPAKGIWLVFAQTTGTSVAKTKDVTNNVGTVTFTATGNGTLSYLILASATETIAALDIGTDATYTITPTP